MFKLDITKIIGTGQRPLSNRESMSSRLTKDMLSTSRPRLEKLLATEHVHDIPQPLSQPNSSVEMAEDNYWDLSDSDDVGRVSEMQHIEQKLQRNETDLNLLKARLHRLGDIVKGYINRLSKEVDNSEKLFESL